MDIIFEPRIGTVVGPERQGIWSGTFWHEPELADKLAEKGRLYVIVTLGLPADFSSPSQLAHSLWAEVSRGYFEGSGSVLSVLKKSIEDALYHADQAIAPYRGALTSESPHFGVAAAVLWGRVLYLAQTGDAQVRLWRRGKILPILQSQLVTGENLFGKLKIQTASGYLEENDLLILESRGFAEAFPDSDLGHLLSKNQEPGSICGELLPEVHQNEEKGPFIVALVLKSVLAEVPGSDEVVTFAQIPEGQPEISETEETRGAEDKRVQNFIKREESGSPKSTLLPAVSSIIKKATSLLALFAGKSLYLRDTRSSGGQRRKIVLALLALLVLTFLLSVGFGVYRQGRSKEKQEFAQALESAISRIDEAQAVLALNRVRSQELLSEAEESLNRARSLGFQKSKIKELEEKISQIRGQALHVVQVGNPQVFFDLSLIQKEAKGGALVASDQSLFIIDEGRGALYKVGFSKNSSEYPVEFAKGSFLSAGGGFAYLARFEDGVFEVNLGNSQKKKAIDKDQNWGSLVDASTFGGNIYLLDPQKSQIWKYVGGTSGFSTGKSYFKDQPPDLSQAISFSIDGSVWILTSDGKVLKADEGRGNIIDVNGLDNQFSTSSIIETNENAKFVYVLDKGAGRIVRFSKEGIYDGQYKGEFLKDAKDLAVDEGLGNIYVLLGSKIFVIKLS